MMNHSRILLMAVLVVSFIFVGCGGKKRVEGVDIPTQPQTNEAVVPPAAPETLASPPPEVPTPTPVPEKKIRKYIVVRGDTLWGISGMDVGYKDNFQWPLIFKENRDQIKDPDLIYPKQEFLLRDDWSQADIDKARKDSSDTPKYVPHTEPRETLPVDYF